MVDVETPPPDRATPRATVRAHLARAYAGSDSLAAMLGALARIAPTNALEFLVDTNAETAALTPAERSDIIVHALRAMHGANAEKSRFATRILQVFGATLELAAARDVAGAIVAYDAPEDRAALHALLERFSGDPTLLRVAIRIAERHADGPALDALLSRLGEADPTPATAAFVYRSRPAVDPRATTARIAFVSSYTIDGLVPFVDLAARAHGIVPQAYVAPFNSWTRDVIDPASGLRAFEPDITFLAVAIDDLVPELAGALAESELATAADTALERVLDVVDGYVAWAAGRPLVVHRFHSAFASPLGVLDGPARADWLAALNARLAAALRERPGTFALDIAAVAIAAGATFADNAKLRHIAAMRLPPTALAAIADAYVRYIVPARGLAKKCVVLDLDNTLWGGVVGEDGKDGIRLSPTARGSEFVEFQLFLRTLSERGILLAVNSKNNPDDALDVIRTHEAIVLRESAFSAVRINWRPKPENMLEIARELNIGVDSLVFVDDNPDERERMRAMLPDVLTVEMPHDPTLYRATLERLPELQTLAITSDDRERVLRYDQARERTRAKATGDVGDYLRSLELTVAIEPAVAATFARIAQLFAKTNQFNATTRRHTPADVERFARDPAFGLWTLASKDRFGDHGLVAVALVRTAPAAWEIDSFLMSCRVIGYGIETALLAHVAEAAFVAGARELAGDFIETKKNAPAKDLYARHGFISTAASAGIERWTLTLTDALACPFPAWIARTT